MNPLQRVEETFQKAEQILTAAHLPDPNIMMYEASIAAAKQAAREQAALDRVNSLYKSLADDLKTEGQRLRNILERKIRPLFFSPSQFDNSRFEYLENRAYRLITAAGKNIDTIAADFEESKSFLPVDYRAEILHWIELIYKNMPPDEHGAKVEPMKNFIIEESGIADTIEKINEVAAAEQKLKNHLSFVDLKKNLSVKFDSEALRV